MVYKLASVKSFVAGFRDALWPGAFIYVITSPLIRRRFFQCCILNGVIFVGSICCLNYIIIPAFVLLLQLAGFSSSSTDWAEFTIDKLYKVNSSKTQISNILSFNIGESHPCTDYYYNI